MLWQPVALAGQAASPVESFQEDLKWLTQARRSRTRATRRESPSLSLITPTPPGFKFITSEGPAVLVRHIRPIKVQVSMCNVAEVSPWRAKWPHFYETQNVGSLNVCLMWVSRQLEQFEYEENNRVLNHPVQWRNCIDPDRGACAACMTARLLEYTKACCQSSYIVPHWKWISE